MYWEVKIKLHNFLTSKIVLDELLHVPVDLSAKPFRREGQ
jgi:hypothetical protein